MAYDLGALIDSTRTVTVHSAVPRGGSHAKDPLTAVLLRQGAAKDVKRARAFQEMSTALQHVRHAGLLPVEDLLEAEGCPFVVAALPPGAPLSRLLDVAPSRARPFEVALVARVVLDAAAAVQVVHAARPELRPLGYLAADSLWVTVEGRAVLFPSARCAPLEPPSSSKGEAEASRYRAPECDGNSPGDESTDVYALGVLLWDLLAAGRAAFREGMRDATGKCPPWLDGSLVRLVMRSLSADPSVRPRDPGAFAAELSRIAANFGNALPHPAPSSRRTAAIHGAPRSAPEETEDALTVELPTVCAVPSAAAGGFAVVAPPVRSATASAVSAPPGRPTIPRPKRPPRAPMRSTPRLRVVAGVPGAAGELLFGGAARRWVVGRALSVDLVVADPDVSREHFEIRRDGGGAYRIHDLGSKNGLFVNGRAAKDHELRSGDELVLGVTRLRFEK